MATSIGRVVSGSAITISFSDFAEKVEEVKSYLQEIGIRMHRDSSMAKMLRDSNKLLQRYFSEPSSVYEHAEFLRIFDSFRIVSAFLGCKEDPKAAKVIELVCKSTVELSQSSQSTGKDLLFEMELLNRIRVHGNAVRMEEPDLIADFGFGEYAIACKKINSMNGIKGQLRKGSQQLRKQDAPGLIAINIDNYVRLPKLPEVDSMDKLLEKAKSYIASFIEDHRDQLQTIHGGKSDGILICFNLPGHVRRGDKISTDNAEQATLYHLTNIDSAAKIRIEKMKESMSSLF